jgi:sialate O-acetylesterase
MPFGFVQLGNFLTQTTPELRWHQTADLGYAPNEKMPNTFMAMAMDTPDPPNKEHSTFKKVKENTRV